MFYCSFKMAHLTPALIDATPENNAELEPALKGPIRHTNLIEGNIRVQSTSGDLWCNMDFPKKVRLGQICWLGMAVVSKNYDVTPILSWNEKPKSLYWPSFITSRLLFWVLTGKGGCVCFYFHAVTHFGIGLCQCPSQNMVKLLPVSSRDHIYVPTI